MGDGRVVVILDVAPLVRRQAVMPRETEPRGKSRSGACRWSWWSTIGHHAQGHRRVLERHNLEVATAKDGIDALERMADRVPDLMLLDIEMPRMDGYELATAMRAEASCATCRSS